MLAFQNERKDNDSDGDNDDKSLIYLIQALQMFYSQLHSGLQTLVSNSKASSGPTQQMSTQKAPKPSESILANTN